MRISWATLVSLKRQSSFTVYSSHFNLLRRYFTPNTIFPTFLKYLFLWFNRYRHSNQELISFEALPHIIVSIYDLTRLPTFLIYDSRFSSISRWSSTTISRKWVDGLSHKPPLKNMLWAIKCGSKARISLFKCCKRIYQDQRLQENISGWSKKTVTQFFSPTA